MTDYKAIDNELLKAVGRWVDARGGKTLVGGNIQIMREPLDGNLNFWVRVKVTGKAPSESENKRGDFDE